MVHTTLSGILGTAQSVVVLSLAAREHSTDLMHAPGLFVFFQTVVYNGHNILHKSLALICAQT